MGLLFFLACSHAGTHAREDALALAVGTVAERATQVLHDRALRCDGVRVPMRFTQPSLEDADTCVPTFHPDSLPGTWTVPSQDLWSGTATVTVAPASERVSLCDDGCAGQGWTWTLAWTGATLHHGRAPDPLDCSMDTGRLDAACTYAWDPEDLTTRGTLSGQLGVWLEVEEPDQTVFWSTLAGTVDDGAAAEVDVRTVHTYATHRYYLATKARSGRFWPSDAEIALGVEGTVDGVAVAFGSLVRE